LQLATSLIKLIDEHTIINGSLVHKSKNIQGNPKGIIDGMDGC
jgi:hypothetical protein